MRLCMKVGMVLVIFLGTLNIAGRAEGASAKFVPQLSIGYNWNDNVYSVDPDFQDPITMQWLNYLLGIDSYVKSQYTSFSLGGWAGYSQYLDASTELKDLYDVNYARFDYYTLDLHGAFQYFRPDFAFELTDDIMRNRKISEIFETEISELSEFYLYTNNVASAGVRFRVSKPLSFLFRYEYQTLIYEEPESDLVYRPADLTRHSGFARIGYQLSPKAQIALDLQGGQWVYDKLIVPVPNGDDLEYEVVDFNYYQALLGFSYSFTPRATLQISGGADQRQYFGEPEGRDLKDHILPVGRVTFNLAEKNKYNLLVGGEYSESKYGQDLFFTYWQGNASFTYYFGKILSATAGIIYKNDTYDREILDMKDIWRDDRQDQLYIANARITLDALRKYDTPYLSFIAGYQYAVRESNIDGELDDYVDTYSGAYYSYDTKIQSILVQVRFNPEVFIGSSQ